MIDEKKHNIEEDEDFIDCPKFKNSIKKLIDKHPDGIEDDMIAKVLNITPQEVKKIYAGAIVKLQKSLDI